jgi:hypothetical protein
MTNMNRQRLAGFGIAMILMAGAQQASAQATLAHRLGRDTMAIEHYTRTANRMTGEVVSRLGAAVTRIQYDVVLAANGRPASATYRLRSPAGTPLPNQPTEIRLTFVGDSVRREAVFTDSVNTRMIGAAGGVPAISPAFGLFEVPFALMRRSGARTMSIAAIGTGAGTPQVLTLAAGGADTIRVTNSIGLTTVYRVDNEGRIQSMDATATTQKLTASRSTLRPDLGAVAAAMRPAGTLSARGNASASFLQSVVFINYGRPQVRERTVWGGELVPFDAVWRTGANEATHLATSRELTFGDVVVPPGLYTLWINYARNAPQLIINRQVGQWGTAYDATRDLGRVPLQMTASPEHVEEFTINIRPAGQGRGIIEFAWGGQMATATFTVR